ncbi:MAG: pyrroloquinoline quinone-dependent dehydrogenase, partial [Acidobacteria bacterium]|nr:pyrroloquinoline quinone-dependent dehydrogenase [Acidobacteriota bacterium]
MRLPTGLILLLAMGIQAHAVGAADNDRDWPVFGGDPGVTQYSELSDINRDNVSTLRLAWSWETGEAPNREFGTSPGIFENTPVVVDGVMYVSTPYNQVVALDAVSGRERWRFDPGAYREGQVPNGMGFVHRGVAVWRDGRRGPLRVFINSRHRLYELDATTGQPVEGFGEHGSVDLLQGLAWSFDPKHYTNTSPPVVWKNLVIVGNGVADRLVYRKDPPGDVRAFDAKTGRLVWSFHTVPRAGEAGAETWLNGANAYT